MGTQRIGVIAMQDLPVPAEQTELGLAGVVESYAKASKADSTRRAYKAQWQAFDAWCVKLGHDALSAAHETVAAYLVHLAHERRLSVSTIEQALSAISEALRTQGAESPRQASAVRAVLQGIRRKHGVAQIQKAPVLIDDLRRMVAALPDTTIGTRDRALLLLGFAGAMRRSEIVALTVADVAFNGSGVNVTIRRSKTDQDGAGRVIGVPYGRDAATCPVRALQAWLAAACPHVAEEAHLHVGEAAHPHVGDAPTEAPVSYISQTNCTPPCRHQNPAGLPLFRSVDKAGRVSPRALDGRDVARAVKRAAVAADLDAANFAGHSLRAGFATQAAVSGKSERAIMRQTGHKSERVARRYIRQAGLYVDNAADGIGL